MIIKWTYRFRQSASDIAREPEPGDIWLRHAEADAAELSPQEVGADCTVEVIFEDGDPDPAVDHV